MLEDWDEICTNISLIWHQKREYILELEMQRIYEVIRIQHKKYSDPKKDEVSDEQFLEELEEAQNATFKAQERARKLRDKEQNE